MPVPTKAGPQIVAQMKEIKEKNHPHLEQALIAVEFTETKPYVKDRLNLGKVSKFSKSIKIYLPKDANYDFRLSLPSEVWYGLLKEPQKVAWLDLLLTQCQVEYEPNTVVVNGKKQVVKDEFGRVEYTDVMKCDDEGIPMWKVVPCDLSVYTKNIKRYGLWFEDVIELANVIKYPAEGV
jgi:hypothetical protein